MGASTSLSKHDLEMIEISWSFVKDKEVIGLNTMIKIFDSSTEIKNMFVFVSGFDLLADIMKNTMARYHSNKVITIMDKIINLLTKSSSSLSEKDINQLVKLGERHYHFGIKTDHFKIFENCFIKALEEHLNVNTFYDKFEIPWRKLIQYIFKQYTDGMISGQKLMN